MIRPVRVLELRSVFGTGGGPEKTILLGAARSDPERYRITVCYLRHQDDPVYAIHQRAKELNVDYVEIKERRSLDMSIWRQLRRIVRERQIQIVHAHEYKTDLLALLLARAERLIPLTTVHGWTGNSRIERRLYYPADKLLIRRFPLAIAVSGEIKDELVAKGCDPARIRVLLNGIDHRSFRRDPSRQAAARSEIGFGPEDIIVGSVGRLEHQKRFDLLISAFARLRALHANVRLVIAGEGTSRRLLERQIASAGLQDSCRLLGNCADIVGFHHALDLFVQSSEYEGTPNVVLEAMALETPMVVTDVGGTAELVRNGQDGIVVRPRSDEALFKGICLALSARAATAARAHSARRRIETALSFDTRMETLERIYDDLVRNGAINAGRRVPDQLTHTRGHGE